MKNLIWGTLLMVCVPLFAEMDHAMVSSSTLNLAQILAQAEKNNPEIRAAKMKWGASLARISQAWTPEKPRVDVERMYAPQGKNILTEANENNLAVTQELPFPSTLYLRGHLAKNEALQAEAAYESVVRSVLTRTKMAYADLYMSYHSIHVFEENTDLMRRFAKVTEAKYAAGKASQSDVLKAQVELSKMQNNLLTAEQEKVASEALLNSLLNREGQDSLGQPEEANSPRLKKEREDLERLALENRPELKEAALAVKGSGTAVGIAESAYLPDLMLQYRRREMKDGPDSQDAILGFSVPLWFWRERAQVAEAKADRDMAEAELESLRSRTLYEVRNLSVKVQTADRLIQLYETSVIPQAEEAMKVAEAGYQSEKSNFLDLLDASRSLLDLRMEHYQHITNYEIALAELEEAVGTDLGGTR
jgi:outer membrane protein, heavy metal efflux system